MIVSCLEKTDIHITVVTFYVFRTVFLDSSLYVFFNNWTSGLNMKRKNMLKIATNINLE